MTNLSTDSFAKATIFYYSIAIITVKKNFTELKNIEKHKSKNHFLGFFK